MNNTEIVNLRDQIAIDVLQKVLQNVMKNDGALPSASIVNEAASISYLTADAMMEARVNKEIKAVVKPSAKPVADETITTEKPVQKPVENKTEAKPQTATTQETDIHQTVSVSDLRQVARTLAQKYGTQGHTLVKKILAETGASSFGKLNDAERVAVLAQLEEKIND